MNKKVIFEILTELGTIVIDDKTFKAFRKPSLTNCKTENGETCEDMVW